VAHNCGVVRKTLITLGILVGFIIAILATWICGGRQLSLFVDRFWTREISSTPVHAVAYEGAGTAGTFIINDLRLSLDDTRVPLNIGSTKDNQFALASGGKVFAFGPLSATSESAAELATVPQPGDTAVFVTRHSVLCWFPLELNLMTGQSPSWKRHMYYQLMWKKPSGATLKMLWRYEQPFYERWGSGFMMREGSTGLVRVDIQQ
jgi:hypothetical protein